MILASCNCVFYLIFTLFEWFLEGYYNTLFCITLNKLTWFQKINSLEQHYTLYLFKVQEAASYNLKGYLSLESSFTILYGLMLKNNLQIAGSEATFRSWKKKYISNNILDCMLSYGENCRYTSSLYCINQTCDKFNGSCLHSCKYGWQCDTGILFCILRTYDCFV